MPGTCFLITSAINIDKSYPMNYGATKPPRTAFSPEERLRQTFYSINSIRTVCPDAKIFLFDISKDSEQYRSEFRNDPLKNGFSYKSFAPYVEYISCEELNPAVAELCRTHESKGLCEASSMAVFLHHYLDKIKEFDYMVKLSGRYFYVNFDKSFLNEENRNKYLHKSQRAIWDWNPNFGFPELINQNGKLHWCPTQTYAVGRYCYDDFYRNILKITEFYAINEQTHPNVDYECMFDYFVLTGKQTKDIPWVCGGWQSAQGDYVEW